MSSYSVMIKPASSLCNLRCRYCFYADVAENRKTPSFGVMRPETAQAVLQNIFSCLKPGDEITFAFQGGEPTMAGLDFFRDFSRLADRRDPKIRVHYALQTNATLLDDAWCEYLRQYDYLVGVSFDLLPQIHDSARPDASGKGTYRAAADALKLLERHRVRYNVLCTLTNLLARHPAAVYKQLLKLDIRYVQFTPCLDSLENDEAAEKPSENVYALTPQRFASFYTALFRSWLSDYRAGNYRSVKLFDDLIGLLATGIPSTCDVGGACSPQFVIESDGSVYPCDFYCTDRYRLGDMTAQTLSELRSGEAMSAFLGRFHARPRLCGDCRYRQFCGGGCKRMQKEICCSENGTFCGTRAFLDGCMPDMMRIARLERRALNNF